MTEPDEISNWEVFIFGLALLDGASRFIDVEDAFVKCYELAPRRFSWRTREDLPDYKKCSKALRDAEARMPPLLIKTADGFKRRLTMEGQQWTASNRSRMAAISGGAWRTDQPKSRPQARLLAEVERSAVFKQWAGTGSLAPQKWRYAELLRCSPDSQTRVWKERLQLLRAAAFQAENQKVMEFWAQVSGSHQDWFAEGGE
jgi:hypothetical protein